MEERSKKILLITLSVVMLLLIIGISVWREVSFDKERERYKEHVSEELKNYRNDVSRWVDLCNSDEMMKDTEFQQFLVSQVQEMIDNEEWCLLREFLSEYEEGPDPFSEKKGRRFLLDAVEKEISGLSPEKAVEAIYVICYDLYSDIEYYMIAPNKNTDPVASYIQEKGINPITTIPGEGYYANEVDNTSRQTKGIDGSPLYDSCSETYKGDFKMITNSGVKLNEYYQEKKYSNIRWFFRDNLINFSPDDGEWIW